MPKVSAGLLMYRVRGARVEVLLVHPGGPFWKKKDAGAWTVPKGEVEPREDALECARREFAEETGHQSQGEFVWLGDIVQKGGKIVRAWAFEGNCDPATLSSNTFTLEWPLRSGKKQEFPEIDRADFFKLEEAREKINPAQIALIDELERIASRKIRRTD